MKLDATASSEMKKSHIRRSVFHSDAISQREALFRKPRKGFISFRQITKPPVWVALLFGGEGETRTPAPVTRPTPLAGAPRHQLEYFSIVVAWFLTYSFLIGMMLAEKVGFEPTVPYEITGFQDRSVMTTSVSLRICLGILP